jgi:triosephosphate isomerase
MTVSLLSVVRELHDFPIEVGAQNAHWATSGAFTGEVSASAIKDIGATFAILGHSERRTYFGETSLTVASRMKAVLEAGLTPVVCVGETDAERSEGRTQQVLEAQLAPIFAELPRDLASRVVIAYEPVWAIGTGKVASEQEIAETHRFIHERWRSQGYSVNARVLYGGSVSPQNFSGIIKIPEVAGALVGGASIKLDQWIQLIAIAEQHSN